MAHLRKHPLTGKPQVRWRDPSGKERSKTFSRTTDARAFKALIEHELQRGLYLDRDHGKTPFGECAVGWLEAKVDLRRSSWARDESYLRNHVMSAFERVSVGAITKSDIQTWIRDLQGKGLSPATIRHCFRILGSIIEEAVDRKLIADSPCKRIALPRVERQEQLYLLPEEIHRLAEAIDPRFKALVLCAAYLGCRWGELVGLKRANLDLEGGTVRIVGTLEEVAGIVRYVEDTKTSASRRTLTIPKFLISCLPDHLAASPPSDFVFPGPEGSHLRRNNFRRRFWKPALKNAGLTEDLRFHDLRHTCASILIAQGAHPKEIQSRLGHSSITTTMDRYGHLFPSLGAKLDQGLDRLYEYSLKSKRPQP
jgi:integrase